MIPAAGAATQNFMSDFLFTLVPARSLKNWCVTGILLVRDRDFDSQKIAVITEFACSEHG